MLLTLLTVCATHAFAEQTAVVTGRALDQTGAVLPGGDRRSRRPRRLLTTVTDRMGTYRFDGVPPGRAELTFRLIPRSARVGVQIAF